MKMRMILCLLCFGIACTTTLYGQENADMEGYVKAMTPNDNHAYLAQMSGRFSYVNTMWLPGMPEQKSTGVSELSMVLGGRYLKQVTSTEMMGMPFEGEACTAYDNVRKKFVSTWIDNFGTGILVTEGQREGQVLTLTGSYINPMTGQTEAHRMVVTVVDTDHHTMEYFVKPPDADEYKTMRIDYKRAPEK